MSVLQRFVCATVTAMTVLFDKSPAPAIERLARIEGQSNFLSLLAGVEAAPDTTQDMAALAFARTRGAIPESLEAHVAQSAMYRLPLMSVVWRAVLSEFRPKEKDWKWIQGAIADAFLLFRGGECKTVKDHAKSLSVRAEDYGAMRKVASAMFAEIMQRAESEFRASLRRESPTTTSRHDEGGRGEKSLHIEFCHVAGHLPTSDEQFERQDTDEYLGKAIGITDRLGYDERNTRPGPVLTLHGAEAEQWCRDHLAAHELRAQRSLLVQPTAFAQSSEVTAEP